MGEEAQGLLRAVGDKLQAGVIFPGTQRELGLFRSVVVLLVHKGSGVSNDASEQVRPKPGHGHRGGAARTASHRRPAPGVAGDSQLWIGRMDGWISQHCGEDLVVDESSEAVRHRVVFEAALAVLAVVTPVFDRDHDEGRQAPLGVL